MWRNGHTADINGYAQQQIVLFMKVFMRVKRALLLGTHNTNLSGHPGSGRKMFMGACWDRGSQAAPVTGRIEVCSTKFLEDRRAHSSRVVGTIPEQVINSCPSPGSLLPVPSSPSEWVLTHIGPFSTVFLYEFRITILTVAPNN